jgi:hypothetical protein
MARELEPWGGEVRLPNWLRRILRRPAPPELTPEQAHEARKARAQSKVSVGANTDRAAAGPMTELYHEGRAERAAKKRR